jgi:hypothetical protein
MRRKSSGQRVPVREFRSESSGQRVPVRELRPENCGQRIPLMEAKAWPSVNHVGGLWMRLDG